MSESALLLPAEMLFDPIQRRLGTFVGLCQAQFHLQKEKTK
jgi:hypothetical protein